FANALKTGFAYVRIVRGDGRRKLDSEGHVPTEMRMQVGLEEDGDMCGKVGWKRADECAEEGDSRRSECAKRRREEASANRKRGTVPKRVSRLFAVISATSLAGFAIILFDRALHLPNSRHSETDANWNALNKLQITSVLHFNTHHGCARNLDLVLNNLSQSSGHFHYKLDRYDPSHLGYGMTRETAEQLVEKNMYSDQVEFKSLQRQCTRHQPRIILQIDLQRTRFSNCIRYNTARAWAAALTHTSGSVKTMWRKRGPGNHKPL
ncbi:hypothetical protein BC830DRAFT_1087459, partial [Chytriomyces sp. MP71]